jgi:hypothetical protein
MAAGAAASKQNAATEERSVFMNRSPPLAVFDQPLVLLIGDNADRSETIALGAKKPHFRQELVHPRLGGNLRMRSAKLVQREVDSPIDCRLP